MAKRLRPLTDKQPKCLLKIGARTLLQRSFDALIDNGISEFVVVTGYRSEMIEQLLKSLYKDITIHFIFNSVFETTNNIYSLWLTRPYTDGNEFLLLDSDIVYDPLLVTRMLARNGSALSVNRHVLGKEEMKVVVDGDNNIIEISKTCDPEKALGESVGIEKMSSHYSSALFSELNKMIEDEHSDNVFYEKAFERLISQGHLFNVVDTTDLFSTELDTVEDFDNARLLIPADLY